MRLASIAPVLGAILALPLILALSAPVAARTLDGVAMPDRLAVRGAVLRLNGMGLRSFTLLHIHGYVAGLYVPAVSHDAAFLLAGGWPKLLRIVYVHGAGLARVRGELLAGRERSCGAACPRADDAAFDQLLATARPVRAGDVTTYVFAAEAVEVQFNRESLVTIRNADFTWRLLDGLIGAAPPSVALRDGLLGVL